MKNIFLFFFGLSFLTLKGQSQTVTDIDGNLYNTITIGSQSWMKENLKTSKFNNGDSIPTTVLSINNDPSSIYQWSYNHDTNNINTYGRLYTWYAVTDSRNVCPTGWHVPSDADWIVLSNFLGGDSVAGSKMKEVGTAHWISTDSTVTNSSDFTALGAGFGNTLGFINKGNNAFFWSSTQFGFDVIFKRGIMYLLFAPSKGLTQSVSLGSNGGSVRCVNDLQTGLNKNILKEKALIFPIPTSSELNIQVEEKGNISASIYNVTGTLVFQKLLTNKLNSIDLVFFYQGQYVIKIIGPNYNVTKKLIKE